MGGWCIWVIVGGFGFITLQGLQGHPRRTLRRAGVLPHAAFALPSVRYGANIDPTVGLGMIRSPEDAVWNPNGNAIRYVQLAIPRLIARHMCSQCPLVHPEPACALLRHSYCPWCPSVQVLCIMLNDAQALKTEPTASRAHAASENTQGRGSSGAGSPCPSRWTDAGRRGLALATWHQRQQLRACSALPNAVSVSVARHLRARMTSA